jgi:hypothetical protein
MSLPVGSAFWEAEAVSEPWLLQKVGTPAVAPRQSHIKQTWTICLKVEASLRL